MLKMAITMAVTAVAGIVGYFLSDTYKERQAQKQRDKIASEVSRGDEAAVNARLGRFRAVWPWLIVGVAVAAGCAMTQLLIAEEGL